MINFLQITFKHPWFLLLLLLIPAMVYWYRQYEKSYYPQAKMPTLDGLDLSPSWRITWRPLLQVLRYLALIALIFALARPQAILKQENVLAEGIDILLALDISSSMRARDFEPDRLEASKKVAADFVDKRKHDRIGLVVFAGESFTQCPTTTDHPILKEFLSKLNCGIIGDGTAIGMGLANAVSRLNGSKAKSKVVILLTDGVNNAGYTSPQQAADAAKQKGIKVYTIGVGTEGKARAPIAKRNNGTFQFGWTAVHIDEDLLREISKKTGGQYFRALDTKSLEEIYTEINRLETTKIETTVFKRYREEYPWFILLALVLIAIEFILNHTIFRTIVH